MKPLTAIALSGGIDSLVAAHLLKVKGHRLIGIHFTTGYETVSPDQVRDIARQLGIPVKIMDCSAAFRSCVVDYFIDTYRRGQTPNPCMICNPAIKFGTVADFARTLGADRLATGHYARVRRDEKDTGRCRLLKGADRKKDQSYFLAFLNQAQLAAASFPLGEMTKSEVRQLAAEAGLTPTEGRESQDICFIPDSYGDFLVRQGGVIPRPGPIADISGRQIGEHKGLHLFTVGQRRGINCPASEPYYVVRTDVRHNRLIVGLKQDLLCPECRVSRINWIAPQPDGPIRAEVRIRYRHKAVPAEIIPQEDQTAVVRFEKPESAVTPGQGAVFYREDEVLGGGLIQR
ncbi:tRNA 2-thiouridine(34) synthase MnmA [Desulfonema ishimotonii]|uniref:tRNA-specific 2-thiouridylase MnmA n=1 Tax=Desulfonema ishimotonii TaxID=45657 RepID=A0A401FVT7_9BACT|nr:tRNA 2-thiouridine(34) synthase MnmA [Desulfonema ishimotonii]GBC61086.1 tRNA 2-thiouridine(34) synthase MnmA [Desulfonema ishimotonii]